MAIFNRRRSATQPIHDAHVIEIEDVGLSANKVSQSELALLLAGAVLLTCASVAQSLYMAAVITQTLFSFAIFAALMAGFSSLEIILPTTIRTAWRNARYGYAVFLCVGFLCASAASLVAGTIFQGIVSDGAQNAKMKQSSEYHQSSAQEDRLQAEASALAVAPDAVQAAVREKARLQAEWERAYAKNSDYFTRDYKPKHVRDTTDTWHDMTDLKVAEDMDPIDKKIAVQDAIINSNAIYQAKVAELERVQSTAPDSSQDKYLLTGFQYLANFVGESAKTVQTTVLTCSNLFMCYLAALAWYGFRLYTERRTLTFDEMLLARRQQAAEAEAEARLELATRSKLDAINKHDEQPEPAKAVSSEHEPAVGEMFNCYRCDKEIMRQTLTHTYCKECRSEMKREAARAARNAKKSAGVAGVADAATKSKENE